MKYTVVFLPLVSFDLKDAIDYYKEINPNLAKQFLSRLREAQHFLISNPYIFQLKYKEVRTLFLKQFPYHLHYLINDVQKQ
jgi:plasmid stabilization system protein ParE